MGTLNSRDEYGNTKTLTASGKYVTVYFSLRNDEKTSDSVSSSDFKLSDRQGRSYNSDYQVREVLPSGWSSAFDGTNIAPCATVSMSLTFDAAKVVAGLMLHLTAGNDVTFVPPVGVAASGSV